MHDYLQLVFQDARFNLYNTTRVTSASGDFVQGEPAFAGALVSLIGQRVRSEQESSQSILELLFEGGACLRVLRGGAHARTPEASEFVSAARHVVEQNK